MSRPTVNDFLGEHTTPLKTEVNLLREIIKAAHPDIREDWKWNAPSYSYKKQYLVTFNLWQREHIHLVWHNPHIVEIQSPLLEGDYPTRRMTHLANADAIHTKALELQGILRSLIELIDKE